MKYSTYIANVVFVAGCVIGGIVCIPFLAALLLLVGLAAGSVSLLNKAVTGKWLHEEIE